MAELPSDFWAGWSAVITATTLLALTWVVFSVYFSAKSEGQGKTPVWDETLQEGFNAPPLWWFWLILSLLVLSVVYLILYPGLGSAGGVMRYSHGGHIQHTTMIYANEFDGRRAEIASARIEMLQTDRVAMASAGRIFKENCAACHGGDARGQAGLFPNLTDNDWQWGRQPEQIEETIRNGRQAIMPPHGAVVGDDGVEQLARYVSSLSNGQPTGEDTEGHELFERYCAACHGRTATGNPLLGAPNLTDRIWIYGGNSDALRNTIANGRNGVMPSFQNRLDDAQVRLLVAWLLRDSEQ